MCPEARRSEVTNRKWAGCMIGSLRALHTAVSFCLCLFSFQRCKSLLYVHLKGSPKVQDMRSSIPRFVTLLAFQSQQTRPIFDLSPWKKCCRRAQGHGVDVVFLDSICKQWRFQGLSTWHPTALETTMSGTWRGSHCKKR